MSDLTAAAPAAGQPKSGAGANAAFTLFALIVATVIAFLDRQLLNLVVDPIRREIQISDTQFSLLQGASFAIVYTIAMIPIAWVADQYSRRNVIIASILCWSAMTVAFGFAGGFVALLLTRAGLAIGEAGLSPASISIVRDTFPKERQAAAISGMASGVYIGGALSLAVGGPTLDWLDRLHSSQGLWGGLTPWRVLFMGAGALGVVGAILLCFVKDPPRERLPARQTSWSGYFEWVRRRWPELAAFLVAYIGIFCAATAAAAWMPAHFMRTHGWSAQTVGLTFGISQLVVGVAGTLGGGWLADRALARDRARGHVYVMLLGVALFGVGGTLAGLLSDPVAAFLFKCVGVLGVGICIGLGSMGFQAMFPSAFSARGVATYLLVTGVLGSSIGPTAVPVIAGLLGAPEAIGVALALCTAVVAAWSFVWLFILTRLQDRA